jgi:hypothetical protein
VLPGRRSGAESFRHSLAGDLAWLVNDCPRRVTGFGLVNLAAGIADIIPLVCRAGNDDSVSSRIAVPPVEQAAEARRRR